VIAASGRSYARSVPGASIAFSPDFQTLYVADSGAETVPNHAPAVRQVIYNPYNVTDPHVVWAFDVIRDGTALGNARPFHLTQKVTFPLKLGSQPISLSFSPFSLQRN
jgi:hypothetical protein